MLFLLPESVRSKIFHCVNFSQFLDGIEENAPKHQTK